jgi:tRNA nucleotidyltransferase (CCA-adding enzyme)
MENQNELKNKHLQFKKKVLVLVALEDKMNKLFKEGKINKKKKKEIKEMISLEWDKAYNRHPYIPQSIKQGFNLLYT